MHSPIPNRKPRDIFADRMAHAAVRSLILVFNLLPARVARWIGRGMGRLVWRMDRKHRLQVMRNLEIAFRGEKTLAEKEDLCRRSFEHLGLFAVEFARMLRVDAKNVRNLVDLTELRQLDQILAQNKGLLCIPAHLGNWELFGHVMGLLKYPLRSVARPLENVLLNDLMLEMRQHSGNVIIEKWKVLWKLKKLLDKREIVTISVDQDGGANGRFTPFFGTLASTIASPVELHVATGSPIIVATINRQPDGIHHVVRVWDVIEKDAQQPLDVNAVLVRVNLAIERAIREYPEQWLWNHKRWRTRPAGELPMTDGLPPRIR